MAVFRTKQYNELSYIIKTFAENHKDYDMQTLNDVVDTMVTAFIIDNRLFNESMFRRGCGDLISQDCISVKIEHLQKVLQQSIKENS